MKKPLRTLFYGMTHEHAPGKIETMKKLKDEFEIVAIVESCRAKNLPFQIGCMYRGNPALQWIWKFVAEGGLGKIGFIEAGCERRMKNWRFGRTCA